MRLTDGGIETVLIFDRGLDLPCFAAFDLLRTRAGTEALRGYFDPYLALAREHGAPFVLTAPTWRASPDWGDELGYTREALAAANRRAVALMREIQAANPDLEITVEGCVGPRGKRMTAAEAEAYHAVQLAALDEADIVTALTLEDAEEAIGIVRAARTPVAISFTVETDGRLASGEALGDAIARTDAETNAKAAYFMVNCAHPEHVEASLDGPWVERIRGLRLEGGEPEELAAHYRRLRGKLPALELLGGCCGTDHRHVAAIARAWD